MAISEIPLSKLYELYMDTVRRCTSSVLSKSDQAIEYDVFEEFDIGVHTFLHSDTLQKLRDSGWLDEQILALSSDARAKALILLSRDWSVGEMRQDSGWKALFTLCDRIVALNEDRNTHLDQGPS